MNVVDAVRPAGRTTTPARTTLPTRTEPLPSARRRFDRRPTGLLTMLAAALVLALGLALAPSALASNGGGGGGGTGTTTHENIVKIDYTIEFNQAGTKYYGEWQGAYPSQIDWSSDGCSFPEPFDRIPVVSKYYMTFFKPSCVIHDFGYRNYGRVKKISMTQATKDLIDNRQLLNMWAQCESKRGDAKTACRVVASDIYAAVRTPKGHEAFFGK